MKVIKCFFIIWVALVCGFAQTGTGSVAGTVLDAKTLKPIPAALVMAVRSGTPPLTKSTRTGGDGTFGLQALQSGKYSLCVQTAGGTYLDPCQWNGTPAIATLASGQTITAVSLRLAKASQLGIQIKDSQNLLAKKTKDGRRPDLTVGVWGPNGFFYSAHAATGQSLAGGYNYQVAIPLDTALKLHISSRDLKLGDATGTVLPANASQQAVQHATGDANPKSFAFTVVGLLP